MVLRLRHLKNYKDEKLVIRFNLQNTLTEPLLAYRIVSYRIISYHIVSYHIVSYHIVSYHIVSYPIVSYRIVSYRIVSYRIVSYRLVSYHIVSYRIVSYRIVSDLLRVSNVWTPRRDQQYTLVTYVQKALMRWFQVAISLSLCLLALPLTLSRVSECANLDEKGLKVGVPLGLLDKDYLKDYLLRFGGCHTNITVVTLNDSDIEAHAKTYIESASIDLLFVANTGLLASLLVLFPQLEPIATAKQNYSSIGTVEDVAGIVVRRSDEHQDVYSWEELFSLSATSVLRLKVCAVRNNSQAFTGFQVQAAEFLSMSNRRLEESFKMRWKQTQQQVLSDVEQRLCDFGAVDAAMPINPSTLALIGTNTSSGFPVAHSTKLYPQGAFVRLPHLPSRLGELFRMSLITMEENDVVFPGGYAGFTFPGDYQQAVALTYNLDLFGDGRCGPGYSRQLMEGRRCEACPKGKFSADGVGQCDLCVPRFYNNETGATACKRCTSGLTTFAKGSSVCVPDVGVTFDPVAACSQNRNRPLVIAVLQSGEVEVSRALWSPTFDDLLNAHLNRFSCSIVMEILSSEELIAAVANKSVDFVFLDAGLYVVLEYKYGLDALAKLAQNHAGAITAAEGGVIFREKSQNVDLNTLIHVREANRNLTLCAVDYHSFSGWIIQSYEFFKQGLDVYQVFAEVIFTGNHEEVVRRVSAGDCDVGMAHFSSLDPNDFALINEIPSNFAMRASTPLYNSWPIAVMPHVSVEIRQLIMDRLYAISYDDEAAIVGGYAGFVRVDSFDAAANVMFDLDRVDPSIGLCRPGSSRNWTAPLRPCQKCSMGRFKEDGWDPDRFGLQLCHACEPGSYGDEVGLAHCKRCPEGKITYQYGQKECEDTTTKSVYQPIEECANKTLVVGVLKDISTEKTISQWKPTFDDMLNHFFNRYECYFEMVVLDWQEMNEAIENRIVDFVFSDPGIFALYQLHDELRALASVLRLWNGHANPFRAGVIFRSSERNADLVTLQNVSIAGAARSLSACPVHEESFEGWHAQWFEFFKAGLDVKNIFKNITFTGSHEETARLVAIGACDVGFVSSNTLEMLAARDVWEIEAFSVINKVSHAHEGFLASASTDLYPDWVLSHLSGSVGNKLLKLFEAPLLAVQLSDSAAIAGSYAGFTLPLDDSAVAQVRYELDLMNPLLGLCPPGSSRNWTASLRPCQKCSMGRFKEDGWDPDRFGLQLCHACEPGSYGDEVGLAHCKRCPEGKITYQYGQKECEDTTTKSVYQPIEECANKTLVVGVLKDISTEKTISQWKPTFDDMLNHFFNRYECYFEMVVLDWQEMNEAIENRIVDFVFSDPGIFALYQLHDELRALASVLRLWNGHANPFRAGVIFRSSERNADLVTLQNVSIAGAARSLSACPVHEESFEGWHAQWFEFFKAGLDVKNIFKNITFTGSHEETARLVAIGACDVGFVSSNTLEMLAARDVWEIEAFSVINKVSHAHEGFLASASTDLYPDWVLSHLSGSVGNKLLKLFEAPLLAVQLSDSAAIAGSYAGFTLPLDYSAVAQVRYELDLMNPLLGLCPPGSSRNWTAPLRPCQKCSMGRFKEDGWDLDRFGRQLCHACEPGNYGDEVGLAHCKRCPEGKITYQYGSTECVESGDAFLFAKIEECAAFPNSTLTVGVLSDINREETIMQWKPTFEDLLNNYFNRYECYFKMAAFNWQELTEAVRNKKVDLVFADAGLLIAYQRSYNLSALASVLRVFNGFIYPSTAGIIFRSSSRNEDIVSLQDVSRAGAARSLTACPVHEDSFEGWHAQWFEFFNAGLDAKKIFANITFTGSHEESAHLVATGACDVGFASSSTLETLAAADILEIETFFIINRRTHSGFIALSSTDLYPSWQFAVLPHVSNSIAEGLDVPLRSLGESDAASIIGKHAGFTAPVNMSSVSMVRFQLGVEPLQSCGPGAYRDMADVLNPCVPCPEGWASSTGVGNCAACPVGYVAPNKGSAACERCPFGFLTPQAGSTTCVLFEAELSMDRATQIVMWCIVAIAISFCLAVLWLVVAYRNTRLMKASSSLFNVVIVTGATMVCAATLLFTVMPTNNEICSARWWIPCIFSSVVFGTLFSKTYRLYSIFRIYERKQKLPHAINFKDVKVAALVGCFVAGTALVLAIFLLVDFPIFEKVYVQMENQNYWTFVKICHVSLVFTPLIFCLYTLLLMSQSVLAWRVRNLPTMFNESRLIAWLLYNTIFVSLVAVMVDFQLDVTQPNARMAVRSVALLIGATTPVVVLYVPKVHTIWRNQQNDSKFASEKHNSTRTATEHTVSKLVSSPRHPMPESCLEVPRSRMAGQRSNRSGVGSAISACSEQSDEVEDSVLNMQLELCPSDALSGDEQYIYRAPSDYSLSAALKASATLSVANPGLGDTPLSPTEPNRELGEALSALSSPSVSTRALNVPVNAPASHALPPVVLNTLQPSSGDSPLFEPGRGLSEPASPTSCPLAFDALSAQASPTSPQLTFKHLHSPSDPHRNSYDQPDRQSIPITLLAPAKDAPIGCESLPKLPDAASLDSLPALTRTGCKSLPNLPALTNTGHESLPSLADAASTDSLPALQHGDFPSPQSATRSCSSGTEQATHTLTSSSSSRRGSHSQHDVQSLRVRSQADSLHDSPAIPSSTHSLNATEQLSSSSRRASSSGLGLHDNQPLGARAGSLHDLPVLSQASSAHSSAFPSRRGSTSRGELHERKSTSSGEGKRRSRGNAEKGAEERPSLIVTQVPSVHRQTRWGPAKFKRTSKVSPAPERRTLKDSNSLKGSNRPLAYSVPANARRLVPSAQPSPRGSNKVLQERMDMIQLALGDGAEDNLDDHDDD
eukprot:g44554.t1